MKSFYNTTIVLSAIFFLLAQTQACSKEAETTTPQASQEPKKEAVDTTSPKKQFLTDNFANGKISGELLNSACPGTVALLSCCFYYEDCLQKGIAAGQKWVYTNSSTYSPQKVSFDTMLASGKYGCNCARPANWVYIDLGIIPEGQNFYGDSEGGFKHYDKVGAQILKAANITSWEGKKKFKELFTGGAVKPGDVFLCKSHTFIYLGDEKFFAAGHDGKWHADLEALTEDSRHAVFDSWVCDMKSCSDYSYSIWWQISFKDSYIPDYYRNAAGKLVKCPLK